MIFSKKYQLFGTLL